MFACALKCLALHFAVNLWPRVKSYCCNVCHTQASAKGASCKICVFVEEREQTTLFAAFARPPKVTLACCIKRLQLIQPAPAAATSAQKLELRVGRRANIFLLAYNNSAIPQHTLLKASCWTLRLALSKLWRACGGKVCIVGEKNAPGAALPTPSPLVKMDYSSSFMRLSQQQKAVDHCAAAAPESLLHLNG